MINYSQITIKRRTTSIHELGTVFYVLDRVEELCDEHGLTEVGSVTLEVGEVSGIIPEYLVDCWNWACQKRREALHNTELKIEELKAVTYCQDCAQTYPTIPQGKTCPYCGSGNTFLVTGNEYNIKEIEAC